MGVPIELSEDCYCNLSVCQYRMYRLYTNINVLNMPVFKKVAYQWPLFSTNFPKRDFILSNQERRNIFLRSRLEKMLSLFGKFVPKGGHW